MKKEKENTKLGKGRRAEEQKEEQAPSSKEHNAAEQSPVQLETTGNVVPS